MTGIGFGAVDEERLTGVAGQFEGFEVGGEVADDRVVEALVAVRWSLTGGLPSGLEDALHGRASRGWATASISRQCA